MREKLGAFKRPYVLFLVLISPLTYGYLVSSVFSFFDDPSKPEIAAYWFVNASILFIFFVLFSLRYLGIPLLRRALRLIKHKKNALPESL